MKTLFQLKHPYIYVELLKKLAVPISQAKNKDLATIINADGKPLFANFMDVLKMIDNKAKSDKKFLQFCSEVGLPNYRFYFCLSPLIKLP